MSPLSIDLDAYFARTGYTGPREPTLQTLQALLHAHVSTIPFENLDVLLGRPIRLDAESLQKKLVADRRGGYCFEQNGLLLLVLEALGFHVRPLSARVRYMRPRDYLPPRTHLFARVELEGESWLADVGVGAVSPTGAFRFFVEGEQSTPHEPRRIIRENGVWYHQVRLGSDWFDVCEFTLEEMPPIDRELANWYTSAHPQSHFKNRLIVARALPDGGRLTLLNRELTRRGRDGVGHVTPVASPEALLQILAESFDLHFTPETRFECEGLVW